MSRRDKLCTNFRSVILIDDMNVVNFESKNQIMYTYFNVNHFKWPLFYVDNSGQFFLMFCQHLLSGNLIQQMKKKKENPKKKEKKIHYSDTVLNFRCRNWHVLLHIVLVVQGGYAQVKVKFPVFAIFPCFKNKKYHILICKLPPPPHPPFHYIKLHMSN